MWVVEDAIEYVADLLDIILVGFFDCEFEFVDNVHVDGSVGCGRSGFSGFFIEVDIVGGNVLYQHRDNWLL